MGAAVAQADVLYWQLTETPTVDLGGEDSYTVDFNYSVAIYATADSGVTKTYLSNYVAGSSSNLKVDEVPSSLAGFPGSTLLLGADLTDLGVSSSGSYADYTFFIEIFNPEGQALYQTSISGTDAVADANKYISTAEFTSKWNSANAWKPSTFSAVPEPTSGMMLLMGMALLALRRRKAA